MTNDKITPKSFPIDDKFQRVMQFARNKNTLNNSSGISNLYVIQKIDTSGNVIDEYYGENLMTDYGMSQYFISDNSFPTKIYIGNGTGSFSTASSDLLSAVTETASTLSNNKKSYKYPLYYDKVSKLITCIAKYAECYFDYNISNITTDVTITEYGIGTAYNNLWTHSWVYDISGSQSSITKKVNERLTFTVYMCMSYYENLITDNYANGIFTVITSMNNFFDNKMYESAIGTYKRDTVTDRTRTHVSSGFMNNQISRYTNLSDIIIYYDNTDAGDYIDGFCQRSADSSYYTIERQLLGVAEPVDIISKQYDCSSDIGFAGSFGRTNYMPFTQFSPTHAYLFNFKTGKWDNEEEFICNSNVWYSDEIMMSSTFGAPIYYTNNSTLQLMYVYTNLSINDPIVSLNNDNIETIYVTDKYWDVSSWVLLTNYSNIPTALQTKRYWITPTNTVPISINRGLQKFKIVSPSGDIAQFSSVDYNNWQYTYGDVDYGWYIRGNTVYCQTTGISFDVMTNNNDRSVYTYDKWMLVFNSASADNTFTLVDMSDLTSVPEIEKITPSFTTSLYLKTQTYRSSTGTGIFCVQDITSSTNKKLFVFNLKEDAHTQQRMIDTTLGCGIWGTDKIAYLSVDDSDVTIIIVQDQSTSDIVNTISLPIDFIPKIICGHTKYLWMSDNNGITYVVNLDTNVTTLCTDSISINNIGCCEFSCVDDVLLIYSSKSTGANTNVIYVTEDPNTIKRLTDFEDKRSHISDERKFYIRYIHDNTLVMFISQSYSSNSINTICELGSYLKTGDVKYTRFTGGKSYVLYGDTMLNSDNKRVPIEYYLRHRLVGTTNTISTINNIKQISGKQWTQIITNVPQFNGLPPGNTQ